jgi:hypothetical protein
MKMQFYSNAGLLLAITAMLCSAAPGPLSAQEKCKMKWEIPAANSNFTQQHVIDVGDDGRAIRSVFLSCIAPSRTTSLTAKG